MKKKFIFLTMMLLTLFGSVKWNVLNAQELDGRSFKLKVFEASYKIGHYLAMDLEGGMVAANGTNSNNAQIFTFESTGVANQYYIKYADDAYVGSGQSKTVSVSVSPYPINVGTYSWGGKTYHYFYDANGHIQITMFGTFSWGGSSYTSYGLSKK